MTTAAQVSVTTTIVTNGASFGGRQNLTQLHATETDKTALQTIAVVTDQYVSCPLSGSGDYRAAGFTSTDSNATTLTITYGAGNGLLDILPESSGSQWQNDASLTSAEVDADGQTTDTTINPDGSYSQTAHFPDGTQSTAVENSDGSATYSFPFGGPNAGPNDTISVGTPDPNASGGPVIPIVVQAPSATPEPVNVPDWYPPGPLVLSSETDQDQGGSALPAACAVPAAIATSGTKIVRTTTRLDTIFGELEQQTITVYTVAGVGVVCSVINDVLNAYYDYTGQGVLFNGVPQQITTFAETMGLQSLTLRHAAAAATATRSLQTVMHVAQARLARLAALRHARALQAIHRWAALRARL